MKISEEQRRINKNRNEASQKRRKRHKSLANDPARKEKAKKKQIKHLFRRLTINTQKKIPTNLLKTLKRRAKSKLHKERSLSLTREHKQKK